MGNLVLMPWCIGQTAHGPTYVCSFRPEYRIAPPVANLENCRPGDIPFRVSSFQRISLSLGWQCNCHPNAMTNLEPGRKVR